MHTLPLPAPAGFLSVGCIQERDGDSLVFAKTLVDIFRAKEITQITCETGLMHETLHKALPDDRNPSLLHDLEGHLSLRPQVEHLCEE